MPDFAVMTVFKSRDQISGTFTKMSRSAGIFGDKTSKAFNRAGKAGSGFGNVLKGVLAAGFIQRGITMLTNGLREVGQQFINLDQKITAASAKFGDLDLTTEEGKKTLLELKEAARTTGALTEKTATEAAAGLEFWALAGVNASQAMALLPGSVDLATIAEKDLARSSDIASDSLGAFGLMTEDTAKLQTNFTRLLDVMAATMTSANTDIETLFEAVKKGAPTFTAAGQSLESFNAIAGILANNAVKGSEAGTMMRNMMLRLAKPSGDAEQIMINLGMSLKDSEGNFKDIIDIIGNFEEVTKGMGTATKTAMLKTVFGARAITGINLLLQEGSESIRAYRTELENAGGTSKEMAAIMRQSLQNRLAALQSAAIELGFQFMETFENLGGDAIGKLTEFLRTIPLSEIMAELAKLEKPFGKIIDSVTKLGNTIWEILVKAFESLFGTTDKNIDVIDEIGNVFDTVSGIIDNFSTGLKVLKPVIGPIVAGLAAWAAIQWVLNTAMSANPIGIIIVAIGLLITGIGLLVKNWDKVVLWFKEGISKIWAWFEKLWNDVLKPIWDFILKIIDEIAKVFDDIGKYIDDLIESIKEFVTGKKTITATIDMPRMEEIKKEKEFIKGLRGEKEAPEITREAPNETEVRLKALTEMKGKIIFEGAPEGTKAEFSTPRSPPIAVEGLGPNK